jgi:hypothetical protein
VKHVLNSRLLHHAITNRVGHVSRVGARWGITKNQHRLPLHVNLLTKLSASTVINSRDEI